MQPAPVACRSMGRNNEYTLEDKTGQKFTLISSQSVQYKISYNLTALVGQNDNLMHMMLYGPAYHRKND